jgi:hypothetical protein
MLYASLLAAAILRYAGCVSVFFLHNLREQLDSSLHRDVETVEGSLLTDSDGQLQLGSHEGEAEEENELDRGYLLEVWSREGTLLYRSEQLRGQTLGPASEKTSGSYPESARSFQLPSGMRARATSRIHHLPEGKAVVVWLAVSEEPLWREFWRMLTVFGIGLPIVVVLVVITGYLVAARP